MTAATNTKVAPPALSKGRIEALSDGVFAIAITFLILEIRVPHLAGEIRDECHDRWGLDGDL